MGKKRSKFINRELSWLEFNQRVLGEALDRSLPLLERLKFLAITGSNLDEFFMVRVGGLQLLAAEGLAKTDASGMTPDEQLSAISVRTRQMVRDQTACFQGELAPALAENGIRCVRPAALSERQASNVQQVFEARIFPILTPMVVTSAHDFPLLVNQTINVGVHIRPGPIDADRPRFAIIPFGRSAPRFLTLPSDGGYEYMLLEDVVSMHIERFFPGEDVVECVPFRITRNADLSVREDLAADLLVQMSEVLDARKQGHCVRLEIADRVTPTMLAFLKQVLEVDDANVYSTPGPLDLASFMQLTGLQGFDHLKFKPWPPQPSPAVDLTQSMFDCLRHHDVLLYHPYESFDPVVRLIDEAADDPDVLAIKQILYRTSRNSPVVAALARAAERGKSVTAIVELKARFDEARNIEWARSLEQSDVQVIYGIKGLKTHAKVCIIVRREPHGIQRYVHYGTGNYNEVTARIYSDVSYMTTNEELAADATNFFNAICGYSQPLKYRKIEAAPLGLRAKLLGLIASEIEHRRQGHKAFITAKLNSLADPAIIKALYEASAAGVKIKLNVRGICCLRPGMKKISANISVVSIVDRFLEHSRVFHFHHGGDDRVFISSADWMPRNLDRRIELLVPVEDPACRDRLIGILKAHFQDNQNSHQLQADGSYLRLAPDRAGKGFRSQQLLHNQACQQIKQIE
ncbi:MAG: RNA degradosome polyphosphate kinase, partial [Planctomycetes bacterium RBG_16_64_10]